MSQAQSNYLSCLRFVAVTWDVAHATIEFFDQIVTARSSRDIPVADEARRKFLGVRRGVWKYKSRVEKAFDFR